MCCSEEHHEERASVTDRDAHWADNRHGTEKVATWAFTMLLILRNLLLSSSFIFVYKCLNNSSNFPLHYREEARPRSATGHDVKLRARCFLS